MSNLCSIPYCLSVFALLATISLLIFLFMFQSFSLRTSFRPLSIPCSHSASAFGALPTCAVHVGHCSPDFHENWQIFTIFSPTAKIELRNWESRCFVRHKSRFEQNLIDFQKMVAEQSRAASRAKAEQKPSKSRAKAEQSRAKPSKNPENRAKPSKFEAEMNSCLGDWFCSDSPIFGDFAPFLMNFSCFRRFFCSNVGGKQRNQIYV